MKNKGFFRRVVYTKALLSDRTKEKRAIFLTMSIAENSTFVQTPFALKACNKESPVTFLRKMGRKSPYPHPIYTSQRRGTPFIIENRHRFVLGERIFCSFFAPFHHNYNRIWIVSLVFFFLFLSSNSHYLPKHELFRELGHRVLCFYSICYFYNKFDRIFMFSDELCIIKMVQFLFKLEN